MSSSNPPPVGYARTASEAEAQQSASGISQYATTEKEKVLRRSKTMDKPNSDTSPNDGPFSHHCADNAEIWKLYMEQAKIFDDNLANLFNSDLDPLLIFAGLFSGILAAFLIEIRKGLQEDLQAITNNLLIILIENQHNGTSAQLSSASSFKPRSAARWVNGLWFSSLMFSLMSALGASLAKGWITQFSFSVSGSSWGDVSLHCRRFWGLQRWHLKLIIECLPILIHIAFFLFSIGLVILLFKDDVAIGVVICILTGLILVLYIGSSLHSAFSSDSPFRTPVSGMFRRLLNGSWRFEEFSTFPPDKDTQKAQALTWLLTESQNVDTVNTAVQAIAGLPINLPVQEQLFRAPCVALLLRILSAELAKKISRNTDSLSACLYALFHLVQAVPADPADISGLQHLVKPGGALSDTDSMPMGVREIALCIKGRIILLLSDGDPDAPLFDTDIPVLAKSCPDAHLRQLLIETCILSHRPSKAVGPGAYDFLTVLRNPHAATQNEAHAQLVRDACSERYLTDSVSKFGAATLLEGLTTGSTELRRRYAVLFAELANDSTFRRQLTSASATQFCSIIQSEDNDVRKNIINALTLLVADEQTQKMITEGLSVTVKNLDQNPRFAPDISRFVVEAARYDGIRKRLAASEIMAGIITMMKKVQPEQHPAVMIEVEKLSTYDDLRRSICSADIRLEIFWMLGHPAGKIRQGTLGFIVALIKHDDVRPLICSPKSCLGIFQMLGDNDPNVRKSALHAVTAIIQHDDIRTSCCSVETISNLLSMLESTVSVRVRESALAAVMILMQYGDTRASICSGGKILKLLSMLEDPDRNIQRSALGALVTLAEYDDVRASICSDETNFKVLSMLGGIHQDVGRRALNTFTAFMRYDSVRASTRSAPNIYILISMLENRNADVRRRALDALIGLAQYHDTRASICSDETIFKVLSMIADTDWDVRRSALGGFIGLAQYDDLRILICSDDQICKLLSMLEDQTWDIQGSVLTALMALTQYDDVRKSICSGDKISKLLYIVVDNGIWDVRRRVLDSFIRYDDVRTCICTTGTILKIISMLRDSHQDVALCALDTFITLMQYHDIRTSICADKSIFKVVSMLADGDYDIRRSALDGFITIAQYDDVRAFICSDETISNLFWTLEDGNSDLRRRALDACIALSQYDDVRPFICSGKIISKVVSMLEDTDQHVKESTLGAVIALTHYDKTRESICSLRTIGQISYMLTNQSQTGVQRGALDAILTLAHYDTVHRAVICSGETMSQVLSLLVNRNSVVGQHALDTFIALTQYDEARESICSGKMMSQVFSVLGTSSGDLPADVQQRAATALAVLAQSGILLEIISMLKHQSLDVQRRAFEAIKFDKIPPVTIPKIISMLEHHDAFVGRSILKIIVALAQDDNFRASICSPETMPKVLSKLADKDCKVQGGALDAVATLAQYDEVHATTFSPDIIQQIISKLTAIDREVRFGALRALIVLAQRDELRASLYAPATTSKVFLLLRGLGDDAELLAQEAIARLLSYLAHDDVQILPLRVEQILNLVDGDDDANYLLFMKGLLARHDTVALVSTALIHNTLQHMDHRSANVRRSYTDLILLLPSSYIMSSDEHGPLMSLLRNPDIAVLNCGLRVVLHFAANVEFRRDFPHSHIIAACMKLLRRHDTAPMAVEIITMFAKYKDTRDSIIHHKSGIVHELLAMMGAGTTDFDRWQVGLKGLLTLGLFHSVGTSTTH